MPWVLPVTKVHLVEEEVKLDFKWKSVPDFKAPWVRSSKWQGLSLFPEDSQIPGKLITGLSSSQQLMLKKHLYWVFVIAHHSACGNVERLSLISPSSLPSVFPSLSIFLLCNLGVGLHTPLIWLLLELPPIPMLWLHLSCSVCGPLLSLSLVTQENCLVPFHPSFSPKEM